MEFKLREERTQMGLKGMKREEEGNAKRIVPNETGFFHIGIEKRAIISRN